MAGEPSLLLACTCGSSPSPCGVASSGVDIWLGEYGREAESEEGWSAEGRVYPLRAEHAPGLGSTSNWWDRLLACGPLNDPRREECSSASLPRAPRARTQRQPAWSERYVTDDTDVWLWLERPPVVDPWAKHIINLVVARPDLLPAYVGPPPGARRARLVRGPIPTESPQPSVWKGVPHRNPTDKTVLSGTRRHG